MWKTHLAFGIAAALIASAALAQPGRYVRKQLKPQFFIPEKELNRQEELPEFNYYPLGGQTGADEVQAAPQSGQDDLSAASGNILQQPEETATAATAESPEKMAEQLPPPSLPAENTTESAFNNYDKQELASLPEYKQKYTDYVHDLKIIAQTGKAPDNPRVLKDLAKMNSNDRITVDDTFGLMPRAETNSKNSSATADRSLPETATQTKPAESIPTGLEENRVAISATEEEKHPETAAQTEPTESTPAEPAKQKNFL